MHLPAKRMPAASKRRPLVWLLPLLGIVLAGFFIVRFLMQPKAQIHQPFQPAFGPAVEYRKGHELSRVVCCSCHLYPEPQLLDKVTWAMEVLPAMEARLGFHNILPFDQLSIPKRVREANIIPEKPFLSVEEWRSICTYYLATAPVQTLPQGPRPEIQTPLKQFQVIEPPYRIKPRTTLVKIDSTDRRIYLGQGETNRLVILDANGNYQAAVRLESPPVGLEIRPDGFYITLIGSYLPSDDLVGKLVFLSKPDSSKPTRHRDILKDLPRTADIQYGDLNQDGREDILVCGYGNMLGQFFWFEAKADGTYAEHVLLDRCGATKAAVHDFNRDGRPDIMVMMAQAREGIYLFENKGQGEFDLTSVVEQVPSWGYSYFELADFNHDGFMDIIVTNGDNGDFTLHLPPFKNYHGIRIYLNDGKNHFKEAYFFPMNGAYKAIARDFDGDGDLDIAAISFYPDYRSNSKEGFVYLRNKGNLEFEAFSFPESIKGRWLTMDAGDLDGDGDLDLVLGAYDIGPSYVPSMLQAKWHEEGPTFFILRNTLR